MQRERATKTAQQKTITNQVNQVNSEADIQSAATIRSLILSPLHSWDLWTNTSGVFSKHSQALISSGIDYRLAPRWVLGALANWTIGKHVNASAMQGGPYTALYQWGFYALATEIWNPEPESYITFAQVGYVAKLGEWRMGPFYGVQYASRNDAVQNQGGFYIGRQGRLSPSVQAIYLNNCERTTPKERDLIWIGGSLSYKLNNKTSINAGYNFEGNGHVGSSTVTLGFLFQF